MIEIFLNWKGGLVYRMRSDYHISMTSESILDSIISGFFKRGGKVRENPDIYKENNIVVSKDEKDTIYEAVDEYLYRNRYGIIDLVKKKYPEIKFNIDDFIWTTYREYKYFTRRTNEHKAMYISGIYIGDKDEVWMLRFDIKMPNDISKLPNENIEDNLIEFRMWKLDTVVNSFFS